MNGQSACIPSNQQPGLPRTSWRELGIHTYIKILIIAGLLSYFFHIEIYRIVHRWVTDASWSHGFLIPFFSLYFLNQRKHHILNLKTQPNYLGLFVLICCLVLYPLVLYMLRLGYPAYLLIVPTFGAVVLFLGGWSLLKYTWLPLAYLVFSIPLPPWLYREVTIPMRVVAAQVAAAFLNLIEGTEATANGVIINVIHNGVRLEPALDVAEACSGMRLLLTFLALGVAMAYLHYRPIWQRIILLLSTIPIAILCNIVRVSVTGFIHIYIGPEYTQGIYHDMLGMGMLPLAFGLYGLLALFMGRLFIEAETKPAEEIIIRRRV